MIKGTKHCFRCKQWKPETDFHITPKGVEHSYCNPCRFEYNRDQHRKYYSNDEHRKIKIEKQRERRNKKGRTRVCGILGTSRYNAKRRNIEFDLTTDLLEAFFIVQNWKCAKTGIPFDFEGMKGKRPFGPSIDRIDPSKGYTADNIQIVCNIYNFAKNQFHHDDVVRFAESLLEQEKDRKQRRLNTERQTDDLCENHAQNGPGNHRADAGCHQCRRDQSRT